MKEDTLVKLSAIQSVAQPVFWGVAGVLFGHGLGLPAIEIPVAPGLVANLAMAEFCGSSAVLLGVAFGGAIVVQIVHEAAEKARPLVDMSVYRQTVAFRTGPNSAERVNVAKEFGISEDRVKLFASRLIADSEFSTLHYADVRPNGRPDHDRFLLFFAQRRMACKAAGHNGKWKPTPRGLKFAGDLLKKLG